MAEEPKKNPDAGEKKEPRDLRDIMPKQDVKGGAQKGGQPEKRSPRKTAEIDFMNWD